MQGSDLIARMRAERFYKVLRATLASGCASSLVGVCSTCLQHERLDLVSVQFVFAAATAAEPSERPAAGQDRIRTLFDLRIDPPFEIFPRIFIRRIGITRQLVKVGEFSISGYS